MLERQNSNIEKNRKQNFFQSYSNSSTGNYESKNETVLPPRVSTALEKKRSNQDDDKLAYEF